MLWLSSRLLASPDWIYGTVGNTEILSEVSPRQTEKIVRDHFLYPRIISLFLDGVSPYEPPPTLLVIVKKEEDVEKYLPREYRGLPVTSEYVPGMFLDQAVIAHSSFYRVLSHNRYRHNYADRILEPFGYPVWFMEGLTEVLASLKIKRGKAKIGLIQDHQLDQIQRSGFLPFTEFFEFFPEDGPNDYRKHDHYYEQAMILIHYFMFGVPPEERNTFFQFVNSDFSYFGGEEGFQASFGYGYSELETRLENYISKPTYPFLTLHLKDRLDWSGPQFEELSPLREQALITRAQVAAGHLDLAYFGLNAALQEKVHEPLIYRTAYFLYYHWDDEDRASQMAEIAIDQKCLSKDFLKAIQVHQPAILTGKAEAPSPNF